MGISKVTIWVIRVINLLTTSLWTLQVRSVGFGVRFRQVRVLGLRFRVYGFRGLGLGLWLRVCTLEKAYKQARGLRSWPPQVDTYLPVTYMLGSCP